MWPFSKKCHYCRDKINGDVVEAKVKVPGYLGLHKKNFCSQEHIDKYNQEVRQMSQNKGKGGCC